jgi:hypothetical protein
MKLTGFATAEKCRAKNAKETKVKEIFANFAAFARPLVEIVKSQLFIVIR